MNVLLVGPFDTKGRYEGGIAYIVNSIIANSKICRKQGLNIKKFDTCRIKRKMTNQGKLNIENIKNTLFVVRDLKGVIAKEKFDVIYFNSSYGIPLLKDLLSIKLSGCKKKARVVLHIHFADTDKILPNKLTNLTMHLLKNEIDHVVFLSKNTCDYFEKLGLENSSVIYNFHNIHMNKEEIEENINRVSDNKARELIFLGSIDRRKGILDLLDALKNVTFPYKLSICGNPIDEEVAKAVNVAIARLPEGAVELKGFLSGKDKENILKKAEIMILPSYGEGLPIVLLEGIASACAIITTSVGAISELFNEKNGAIINPGDIGMLTDALYSISDTLRLKEIMRINFKKSEDFGIESFIKQFAEVCAKVLLV